MHHATNAIALMTECTFWQMVPCLPTTQQKDRAPLFTCICRIINNPEVFRPLGHSNATPSFDAELEILTNGVAIQYRESLAILFTLLTKKKKEIRCRDYFNWDLKEKNWSRLNEATCKSSYPRSYTLTVTIERFFRQTGILFWSSLKWSRKEGYNIWDSNLWR